jgi:hypothetical protein
VVPLNRIEHRAHLIRPGPIGDSDKIVSAKAAGQA